MFVDRRVRDLDDRPAGERRPPGQHLEQDRARGEQIRPRVERLAEHLFRRHVARRADDGAGARELRRRHHDLIVGRAREAEVEELHAVRREEHVRRLEIAVDDAARVERRERGQHAEPDRDRL